MFLRKAARLTAIAAAAVLLSSNAFTASAALPIRPVSASPKVVSQTTIPVAATVGDKITLTKAKLNSSAKSSFAWYLSNKAIKNQTKTSLTITKAYLGKTIYALETVKFKTGKVVKSKSNVITIGRIAASKPTLNFTDQSQVLIASSVATATPNDSTVTYSWAIDGTDIPNAAAATLTVGPHHEGRSITVTATYKRTGYTVTKYTSTSLVVAPKAAPTLNLLWSQEFSDAAGSSVDEKFWNYDLGDGTDAPAGPGWGNNERQSYTTDAAKIDGNGNLVITANRIVGPTDLKCAGTPCSFTSARIKTHNKIGFKHGRLEARIKVTGGQGVWPAFWTLGANLGDGSTYWPGCGELDIAEWRGSELDTVNGTMHMSRMYGGAGVTASKTLSSPITEWHTYTLDWAPDRVSWYVDGVLYHNVTRDEVLAPALWPFNNEHFVLLNVAIGGNFVGNSIDPNLNSATMTVDWLRYYSVNGVGELIDHSTK